MSINYNRELVGTLVNAKVGIFASSFLFPFLTFFIFQEQMPKEFLYIWIIAHMIIYVSRIVISKKILKFLDYEEDIIINKNLKLYLFVIAINAILWGFACIFALIYSEQVYVFIMLIILLGIITASTSTLNSVFHAVFIFATMLLSIVVLSLIFIGGTSTYYFVALFSVLYYIITIPSSYKSYSVLNKNIQQKKEIELLNKSLKDKNSVLEDKNDNFKILLDTTIEAMIISDENYLILDTNEAGLKLFNVKNKDNIVGKHLVDYVPEYELDKLKSELNKEFSEPVHYDLMKANKEIFPALARGRYITVDSKKLRISAVIDLSQIKKQEMQLLSQSRLAQMGEMISMIAHQWRQPLGAISATSINLRMKIELKMFDLEADEGRKECQKYFNESLENIEDYTQALTQTIDDFKNFYKKDKQEKLIKIEEPIRKAYNIIKTSLEVHNISIIEDCQSQKNIRVYAGELMQVILNILKNAQDNFLLNEITNPKLCINTSDTNTGVKVVISDNGGGIDESIVNKIFDPYFSTKDEKNGTGLGLYMSKIIIEEHHAGSIEVVNVNNGACFTLLINDIRKKDEH